MHLRLAPNITGSTIPTTDKNSVGWALKNYNRIVANGFATTQDGALAALKTAFADLSVDIAQKSQNRSTLQLKLIGYMKSRHYLIFAMTYAVRRMSGMTRERLVREAEMLEGLFYKVDPLENKKPPSTHALSLGPAVMMDRALGIALELQIVKEEGDNKYLTPGPKFAAFIDKFYTRDCWEELANLA